VLFERARWFQLWENGAEATFSVDLRLQDENGERSPVSVVIGNIRTIVFEFQDECRQDPETPGDPLNTGFFTADCWFKNDEVSLPHLMSLNEACRYWMEPWHGHAAEQRGPMLCGVTSADPVETYLTPFLHDFLQTPLPLAAGAWATLCPKSWVDQASQALAPAAPAGTPAVSRRYLDSGWVPYIDARAFVWSCAVSKGGCKDLALYDQVNVQKIWESELWLHYLNVDSPGWCEGRAEPLSVFNQKWAEERTYTRWLKMGSAYGFSQHSGMAYVSADAGVELGRHWAGCYFDQTLLLLYVRTCSFRFSRLLSDLTASTRTSPPRDWDVILPKFEKLRWWFAQFTNLYQFPLLSNQQQGVEMYAKTREGLDIDALLKEVRDEIETTDEYLSNKVNLRQQQLSQTLNVVAVVGIAASLAMQLATSGSREFFAGWTLRAPLLLASIAIFISLVWWRQAEASKSRHWGNLAVTGLFAFLGAAALWPEPAWLRLLDLHGATTVSFAWTFILSIAALGVVLAVADPLSSLGAWLTGGLARASDFNLIRRLRNWLFNSRDK